MAENRQPLEGCEHQENILNCHICNRPIGLVDLKRTVSDIKQFIATVALLAKKK